MARGSGATTARATFDPATLADTPDQTAGADAVMAQVMSPLWDDFGAVAAPLTLVRGSTSPVVDDEDVAEAQRRQPGLEVLVVDGAGHSVQGDRPVEFAALLRERLD